MNAYVVYVEETCTEDREFVNYQDIEILGAFGTEARAKTFILGLKDITVRFGCDTLVKIEDEMDIKNLDAVRTCYGEDEEFTWIFEFYIKKLKVE